MKQQQQGVVVDPSNPDWLSSENDERIVDELLEPLFGTGTISLIDDTTNDGTRKVTTTTTTMDTKNDVEKGFVTKTNTNDTSSSSSSVGKRNYGTMSKKNTITTTTNDNNDDDNDDDPTDLKTTIITNTGTTSSTNKNNNKNKKRLITIDPDSIKPHRPTYNPCLYMFHILEGSAITSSVALLITQLIPFLRIIFENNNDTNATGSNSSQLSSSKQQHVILTMNILTLALHIYISLFCILFIMTELGNVTVHKSLPILQYYSNRGFLYSFLGLICAQEAYSERINDVLDVTSKSMINVGNVAVASTTHMSWVSIFMEVSSWVMLSIGMIYILLGIFCCKKLRDHYQQKEIDEWKQYKLELQSWKQLYG